MQSEIESLKLRITELEARNVELETENAEIPELRKKLTEIPELRKKLAEVEARNAELMQRMMEENNRPNFNSGADQGDGLKRETPPPHHEKPLEDEGMDDFLNEVNKKSIGEDIRIRNQEKKIQRESANQDITPEPVYIAETNNDDNLDEPRDRSISEKSELFGNFVNKIHNFHDRNIDKSIEDNRLDCDLSSRKDLPEDDDFTVPSEQEVERDLMQQLSVPSTSIDTEISLTPPVIDKKQQFSVTAECIVYKFRKAVRSGHEEILHWYGKKLKNYFQILVMLIYVSNYLEPENYINYLTQ